MIHGRQAKRRAGTKCNGPVERTLWRPSPSRASLCPGVVLIVISAWLAVLLFGLFMCRLGARSDDAHAVAVAEWIAATRLAEPEAPTAGAAAGQLQFGTREGPYRATG